MSSSPDSNFQYFAMSSRIETFLSALVADNHKKNVAWIFILILFDKFFLCHPLPLIHTHTHTVPYLHGKHFKTLLQGNCIIQLNELQFLCEMK